MKKMISLVLLGLSPLLLAGCDDKPDKKAVVVCHSENYVKAGGAARAAGGTFYTCGGRHCIITNRVKIGKTWTTITASQKYPGEFTITKGIRWSTSGCGTIYKKAAK